jgi:hypothetical protein
MAKGCGCALLILLVAGIVIWALTRDMGSKLHKQVDTVRLEGQKRGAGLDEKGCLAQAIEIHKKPENQNFAFSLHEGLSFYGCLETAKPTADFCQGVPDGKTPFQGGIWEATRCKAAGFNDIYCASIFKQLIYYCATPERQKKLAAKPA